METKCKKCGYSVIVDCHHCSKKAIEKVKIDIKHVEEHLQKNKF
jgi:uncharacterized OB-fold protein